MVIDDISRFQWGRIVLKIAEDRSDPMIKKYLNARIGTHLKLNPKPTNSVLGISQAITAIRKPAECARKEHGSGS